MKKLRFWAFFGIVVNAINLFFGLASFFVDAEGGELLAWIGLGLARIIISTLGLLASIWILQRKTVGLSLARRQVWLYALTEVLGMLFFLFSESPEDSKILGITAVFILAFASQLSRLFNSEEAKNYCLN